jgi:hypothetical protein
VRALDELRGEAYRTSAVAYMRLLRPYEGRATLFLASQRIAQDPLLDPQCGFGGLVRQLDTVPVDAHHLTLLESPAVASVAAALLARIPPTPRARATTETTRVTAPPAPPAFV